MTRNNVVMLLDEETVKPVVLADGKSTISSTRILRDTGEMFAEVTIARTGIMLYKAKELGEVASHLDPDKICRVRTKAEVLFDEETISACRSLPFTIDHPKDDVTIENNKELQKGFLEGVPHPDGSHLAGTLVLNDKAAIRLVDSGVDQVSLGHGCILEPCTDGEADFDKTKIFPNHIALVRRGRAQTTRIGDSGEEIEIVDKPTFDAVEAERDAAKTTVKELQQKLADAEAVKLTDEAIQAEVERRVQSRTELLLDIVRLGDDVAGLDFTGKSETAIKREVVSKLYDNDFSSKSDDYIASRFDAALEGVSAVTLSDALSDSLLDNAEKNRQEQTKEPNAREAALKRRAERYNK